MVKFITRTICMALVAVLCVGSLNAQMVRKAAAPKPHLSAMAVKSPSPSRDVVYTEGFESTTGTNLPTGWVKSNSGTNWITIANGQTFEQVQDIFAAHGGTRSMGRSWYRSGNNWAFSAGFALEASVSYTVKFWFSAPGYATYGEHDDFEVKIGAGQTAGDMTANIFSNVNNDVHEWTLATGTFVPATAGTYYLGFHDLNPTECGIWIAIDDIEITGGGTVTPCPAVTNVTAVPFESNKAKVDWTAPAGKALTGYKIYQDGVEKGSVGAAVTTWTSAALANGTYTFSVAAIYDDGCTPVPVPAAPITVQSCTAKVSGLAVQYTENCDKATISWNPPAKTRGVLWDNTEINAGTGGLISTYWSGNAKGAITADDFDVNSEWVIEKIISQGFSNEPAVPPTKMAVGIYKDNGGKPGAEVYKNNSIDVADGTMPEIVLPTPVTISEPGKYWVSIAGTYDINITDPNTQLDSYRWNIYYGPTKIGSNYHLQDLTGWFGIGSAWTDASTLVSGSYSMYFKIEGTKEAVDYDYNVYMDDAKIAGPIKATSFEHTGFVPTQKHKWSVAVACSGGGEGEWISITDTKACDQCDKPINAKASFNECTATLTWLGAANAKEFRIERDGVEPVMVAASPYTETAEFVDGESYTWTITTICNSGTESEGATVSAISHCSGDAINELSNSIAIFPNPTNGTINITVANANFAKVEVYNTVGQLIETKTVNTFDVSSYNTGIYFFKVYDNDNNSVTKRVMVTK